MARGKWKVRAATGADSVKLAAMLSTDSRTPPIAQTTPRFKEHAP
jgi:hypothetical protein